MTNNSVTFSGTPDQIMSVIDSRVDSLCQFWPDWFFFRRWKPPSTNTSVRITSCLLRGSVSPGPSISRVSTISWNAMDRRIFILSGAVSTPRIKRRKTLRGIMRLVTRRWMSLPTPSDPTGSKRERRKGNDGWQKTIMNRQINTSNQIKLEHS